LRLLTEWLATLAVAGLLVLSWNTEVAQSYRVPSASMEPTIHCAKPADQCEGTVADRIIACRVCYRFGSPHRGQIVVFHAPPAAKRDCGNGGNYVKRLIGLPGEAIHEDADGRLWVDGLRLNEPYVTASARAADRFRNQTWTVPPHSYFMLGDNRGDSCDSRTWGAVPRDDLVGPVTATYWPPARIDIG
jgi:signal peptidase I